MFEPVLILFRDVACTASVLVELFVESLQVFMSIQFSEPTHSTINENVKAVMVNTKIDSFV